MSDFGYIQIEFDYDFKKSLLEWSQKSIDSKYLICGETDGKSIGGLVAQNAHITLAYGIPVDTDKSEEIYEEVQKVVCPKIKISGIKYFSLKQYGAKILYLSIDDENNVLAQIHEKLKKFISEELQNTQPIFVPHIAIAYVSEDFNERELIYDNSHDIKNVGIKYHKS